MYNKIILIVDDEIDIVEPFQEYLIRKGFKNTLIALDGVEALAAIEKHKPDLILLDIQLKCELDGIEIIKKTKKILSSNSKVIMISGYGDTYEKVAFEAGADDFWKKPIMPSEIFEKIKHLLA